MQQKLILDFMDGEQSEAILARPFAPRENEIEVTLEDQGLQIPYPLYDLACIKMLGTPSPPTAAEESREEVETVAGARFHVSILTRQKYPLGFYGLPLDTDSP